MVENISRYQFTRELTEKLSIEDLKLISRLLQNVCGVVLGKVLKVEKHREFEKLSICIVSIGNKNNLQIVCGAKNVKPDIFVYVARWGRISMLI